MRTTGMMRSLLAAAVIAAATIGASAAQAGHRGWHGDHGHRGYKIKFYGYPAVYGLYPSYSYSVYPYYDDFYNPIFFKKHRFYRHRGRR